MNEVIDRLMDYAGKVDAPTARKAGLLAPRFTLAEAIVIADALVGLEEVRAATSEQLNAALDERDAAIARADDLSRTVAAMGEVLEGIARGDYSDPICMKTPEQQARAILSRPDVAALDALRAQRSDTMRE